MNYLSLLLTFLPIVSINTMGFFFNPGGGTQYKPIFQPPNWLFGLIWTYITLSFGIVSAKAYKTIKSKHTLLILYFILLLLLNLWLVLNDKKLYKQSFWLLVITSWVSIIYLMYLANNNVKYIWWLLPLPFWLILASCLNGVIYDNKIDNLI